MSVFFDVETEGLPRDEVIVAVPPFPRDEVKLGNRKDPETIMKFMENAEEDYYERFVDRAALDARTGTVLCIGIDDGDFRILEDKKEENIISSFWNLWKKRNDNFVGFNIHRFDLPFLVRRSWARGVTIPPDVYGGRYFHPRFIDLMAYWSCGNRDEMISLEFLAKFLGLSPKKGNGKNFADQWWNNHHVAVEYLKTDLELVFEISRKMGLVQSYVSYK